MNRREFIAALAGFVGAAALGALGGVTSTEEGRKKPRKHEETRESGEVDDDEPPSERTKRC